MNAPLSWLVGAGGLLGQHVKALLGKDALLIEGPPVPWQSPRDAQSALRRGARLLREQAGAGDWQLIWCAGAGVLGTSPEALRDEVQALKVTLETLAPRPGDGATGAVFLPSSVGGVYAGVGAPPYGESSPVRALSEYGRSKIGAEEAVISWANRSGARVLIGRITNLFGPGQDLGKEQGLISRICLSHLERMPVRIWVPLDTRRDYLFAGDCAALIVSGLERLWAQPKESDGPVVVTKILGSGRPMSVAAVLGEIRRLLRRPPLVILSASPTSAFQVRDLSVSSTVWPDLDRRTLTTFPAGVLATLNDLRRAQLCPAQPPWGADNGARFQLV